MIVDRETVKYYLSQNLGILYSGKIECDDVEEIEFQTTKFRDKPEAQEHLPRAILGQICTSISKLFTKVPADVNVIEVKPPEVSNTYRLISHVVDNYITGDFNYISNGCVCASLTDSSGYVMNVDVDVTSKIGVIYPIGTVNKSNIFVDPYMRWDDRRIIKTNKKVGLGKFNVLEEDDCITVTFDVITPEHDTTVILVEGIENLF